MSIITKGMLSTQLITQGFYGRMVAPPENIETITYIAEFKDTHLLVDEFRDTHRRVSEFKSVHDIEGDF